MVKYIKECPEKEFMMFLLIYLVEHRSITEALSRRMEEMKTNKEKNNE